MSCVVLQVGQCGNQVGSKFWDVVQSNSPVENCFIMHNSSNGRFYYRSINVDTELKVVQRVVHQRNDGLCIFRPSCAITEKCGRGNNWAMGYYMGGTCHTHNIFDRTMEEMRKECERGDQHRGTLLIHGLSGGTGSGVSSRLSQLIREEFPSQPLLACSIAPFEAGDTAVQNYNSLLTLHKLYESCDAILLQENDLLMAKASSGSTKQKKQPALSDLNQLVANVLAGLLMPVDFDSYNSSNLMMENLVDAMSFDNNKIISSVFQEVSSWEGAPSKMLTGIETFQENTAQNKKLLTTKSRCAYFVVARDSRHLPFHNKMEHSMKKQIQKLHANCNQLRFQLWKSNADYRSRYEDSASLTMAYKNETFTKEYLGKMLQRAIQKFQVKAYIHWYERFGGTVDDFKDCFHYFHRLQNCL